MLRASIAAGSLVLADELAGGAADRAPDAPEDLAEPTERGATRRGTRGCRLRSLAPDQAPERRPVLVVHLTRPDVPGHAMGLRLDRLHVSTVHPDKRARIDRFECRLHGAPNASF